MARVFGVLVVVVCLEMGCLVAAQRPQLSSFSSYVVSLSYGAVPLYGDLYIDIEGNKQLQVVQIADVVGTNFTDYLLTVMDSNTTCTQYEFDKPFLPCVSLPFICDASAFNYWSFVDNMTMNGTRMFAGVKVEIWLGVADQLELGVSVEDPTRPIYLSSIGGFMIFITYDGTTPSSSVFDIPKNCTTLEAIRIKEKHLIDTRIKDPFNILKKKL